MPQIQKKLGEIADLLSAELRGDPNQVITGIATLQNAQPGQLSFLNNPRYRQYLPVTQASVVIVSPEDAKHCRAAALITNNPYLGYAKAAAFFDKTPRLKPGIHPTAILGKDCQIHPTASIGPLCVLSDGVVVAENVVINSHCNIGENSYIGANSCLWFNVTVYHEVRIGERSIIHSGVVIGSDGFGIASDKGVWYKIPQIGAVVIGNDVEIGANTTVDRGALDNTVIEDGVKLDNQIQIGHNVRIGAHTAIAGCVGIAGSTSIGKRCGIGGGVGILGHLTIADDVMITAGTGVSKSITQAGVYSSGIDAQSAISWKKNLVRIYQLDETVRKVRELEKTVAKLRNAIGKEESL